jgi:hypothetical protein
MLAQDNGDNFPGEEVREDSEGDYSECGVGQEAQSGRKS